MYGQCNMSLILSRDENIIPNFVICKDCMITLSTDSLVNPCGGSIPILTRL